MIERYSQDGNSRAKIETDEFGNIRFRREIYVSPEVIEYCRRAYEDSKSRPAGDEVGDFACIVDNLYFDWLFEGFDCTQVSPKEVVARLRAEGLEYLITNAKI